MSDLAKRFKFYGIGLIFGTILVLLFFGRRSSCRDGIKNYFPSGRVCSEVAFLPKVYRESALIQLSALSLDTVYFNNKVLRNGNIDFGRSAPREKPCGKYILEHKDKKINLEVLFMKCKDTVYIEKIIKKSKYD